MLCLWVGNLPLKTRRHCFLYFLPSITHNQESPLTHCSGSIWYSRTYNAQVTSYVLLNFTTRRISVSLPTVSPIASKTNCLSDIIGWYNPCTYTCMTFVIEMAASHERMDILLGVCSSGVNYHYLLINILINTVICWWMQIVCISGSKITSCSPGIFFKIIGMILLPWNSYIWALCSKILDKGVSVF